MKVSLNWIKEYLDLTHSPEEIANALTLAGLESEGIEEIDGDVIFEIGLTPNLGHCMSVIGMARELSAILQIPLRRKELTFTESGTNFSLKVKIENGEDCHRYLCRKIEGTTVGVSPDWLVKKLESVGVRSVNNVVDIGNLVMLELGQPLHMFDADQIGDIQVRRASNDGKLNTLDEVERQIPDGTLLVCTNKKPVAFAGVMGELSSAVSESTKNVVIEAAEFSPQAVRYTSKQLNLRTDSSLRFERGVDPLSVSAALDMAAALLADIAGGTIAKGTVEAVAKEYTPTILELRPDKTRRLLGVDLSVREICILLGRLEIEVLEDKEELIRVAVPSYRNDLTSEIDLIEEVGRMYGFNNIPRNLPRHVSSTIQHAPVYLLEEKARTKLVGLGLQECLTCDLISPQMAELTGEKALTSENQIAVLHPASVDQSILRTTLLPGLLQVVKFNLDRQNPTIAGFEVGHIHFKEGDQFFGEPAAGIILTGSESPYHFADKPKDVDFFGLKGQVESFLASFGVDGSVFTPSHLQNFHPQRQAHIKMGDTFVGALGEVHPEHLRQLGISQRVYYAEINLHDLMQLEKTNQKVKPLAQYPGSWRDWTVTVEEKIPISNILDEIQAMGSPILEKVFLLDFYKSEKLGKNRKNITLRFEYRDSKKTVNYEEVEKEHTKLTEHVAKKFQVV